MQVLRAADRIASPWKNGGGVTREVAIWPPNATLTAFDWRISIADIAAGGPFSVFPGVDRVLTVIAGRGLSLEIEGLRRRDMDEASPPLAFPGEAGCEAILRDGPIRDLNLMVRRDAYVARARRSLVHGATTQDCTAEVTIVMALGPILVADELLVREDVVMARQGESLNIRMNGAPIVIGEIDLA